MSTVTRALLASLVLASPASAQVVFNEIRMDQPGADVDEFIELRGTAGADVGGLTLLILGDGTPETGSGVVEWKYTFPAGTVLGSNGYLVLHGPGMTLPVDPASTIIAWPVGVDPAFPDNGPENSDSLTFLLVSGYSGTDAFDWRAPYVDGSAGQDLDTNDDGVLDVTPWTDIVDSIAVKGTPGETPATSQDWWYGSTISGPFISRFLQTATTGTTLAYWNQNNNSLPGGGFGFEPGDFPQAADAGLFAGQSSLRFGGGLTDATLTNGNGDTVYQWLQSFGGTASGALNGDASGGSIALQGGTVSDSVAANNGAYLEFRLPTTDWTGVQLTFFTQRTSTGFNSNQVSYSFDGVDFTAFGDPYTPAASWANQTINFGGAIDNRPEVWVRIAFDGATSTTGNNRLDNIQFLTNPVSETSVVTTYGVPFYVVRNDAGEWLVGPGTPATGWDTPGADNAIPALTCGKGAGDCTTARETPYCSDECCCETVCAADPFCCEVRWDSICATSAADCSGEGCGGTGCVADLNGDGSVDGVDLGVMLGNWGPGGETDLNQDGAVDGVDLGILLGGWGACAG